MYPSPLNPICSPMETTVYPRGGVAVSKLGPRRPAENPGRRSEKLVELVAEQAARAKTHAKAEAQKGESNVLVSDPEARVMRLADGATAPACNVQVATAQGFIVEIDPTDRRRDSGLAPGVVDKVAERCGQSPQRVLADTTAMTQKDIVALAEHYPAMTVYSPPPPDNPNAIAKSLRTRRWKRRHEPLAVKTWRARMASEEGQEVYRRRKLTERAHAVIKNRGMSRFLVHGRDKVRRSNTMGASFCLDALDGALRKGRPEIFNTDQGAQFTSVAFTDRLAAEGVRISMDGPTKNLSMFRRRARVHGTRLGLQLVWFGSGYRSVLGCALRGLGGAVGRRPGGA